MQELEAIENMLLPMAKNEVLPKAVLHLGTQGQFAWEVLVLINANEVLKIVTTNVLFFETHREIG